MAEISIWSSGKASFETSTMTLVGPSLRKILHADIGKVMKCPHVGDIDRDLHDVLHIRFVGDENSADVLQNLDGLRAQVALPDHLAGFVDRNLAGDKQQRAARNAYRIGIVGLEGRRDGARIADFLARLFHRLTCGLFVASLTQRRLQHDGAQAATHALVLATHGRYP